MKNTLRNDRNEAVEFVCRKKMKHKYTKKFDEMGCKRIRVKGLNTYILLHCVILNVSLYFTTFVSKTFAF